MSYSLFLVIFLCLPLALLFIVSRHNLPSSLLLTFAAVTVAAIIYTGPWDSAIIRNGVWSYTPAQVIGLAIGGVPIEEYAFYVLQVLLTGLVTAGFLRGWKR